MKNIFRSYKSFTIIFAVLFIISFCGNVYLFGILLDTNNEEVNSVNQEEHKESAVNNLEMKEIEANQYEIGTHAIEHGERITYTIENGGKLSLKKGDNVEFRMKFDTDITKPVTLGYYCNDEYIDFFTHDVEDEASVMWVVPEKGEYSFYSEGVAPEGTTIQQISIKLIPNQKQSKVKKITHDPIDYTALHKKNIEMIMGSNGYEIGEHTIHEGDLMTYTRKNGQGISLKKDQIITIEIGLQDNKTANVIFGDIQNGKYTEMFSGSITKEGKLTWIVSEDGEYVFYCIGMSGDTKIKNISIQD